MDRIKIIILIFALSFCTANGYACYDDDDDDWSQYDEYDYDDCDDEDEDDDDDDPNAFYYNDGSILMDEVVVTAPAPRSDEEDDEEDDDDWWRRYENNNSSDEDDGYGYDGDEDCYIRGGGTDSSNNSNNGEKDDKGIYRIKCKDGTIIINIEKCEAYILSDKDKLIVDKMNIPVNYVQMIPNRSCFIAGMSLAEQIFTGYNESYESLILYKYGQLYGPDKSFAIIKDGISLSDINPLLQMMFDLGKESTKCSVVYNNNGYLNNIDASLYEGILNKGHLMMTDIYVEGPNNSIENHNIVIFGMTVDECFLCYDTIGGQILRLKDSDFVHSYIVDIWGANEKAFK